MKEPDSRARARHHGALRSSLCSNLFRSVIVNIASTMKAKLVINNLCNRPHRNTGCPIILPPILPHIFNI